MSCTDRYIIATHSKQQILPTDNIPGLVPNDIIASIQNAPAWKTHLLQHFHIPDTTLFLSTLQNADIKLIVVSDGGLYAGKGSFGVAFGTGAEDLGHIEGPAPGNPILLTSLRSEAYGVLAALSFLNLYVQSYNIDIPAKRKLHLYSDNLGLVLWLKEILAKGCYARMYLRAEADVLLQIEKEIIDVTTANFELHVAHVKGHRDDLMTYNALPREAQLNVQADASATNYLRQGFNHTYEELTANTVSFYICKNLITRDFKRQIRSASRSPELRKYLIKKYLWHPTTPNLIWWHIHGKSIASFSKSDQRRIRKYIVSWLPTCERLHMEDPNTSEICPSCTEVETHKHLLHCVCSKRSVLKNKWFFEFKAFLLDERYTPPIIQKLLYDHLHAVVYPHLGPATIPDDCDAVTLRAIEAQLKIGWHQLLYGRISIIWGNIISIHLAHNKVPDKEMTTDRWGKLLIGKIFQLILEIWECRNSEGHASNERNESQLSRQRILDKIRALQESNPEVRYCDRGFIFCSMENLEKYSLGNLLSCSIIRAQSKYRIPQNSIRDLFPVQPLIPLQLIPIPEIPPAPDPDIDTDLASIS